MKKNNICRKMFLAVPTQTIVLSHFIIRYLMTHGNVCEFSLEINKNFEKYDGKKGYTLFY